MELTSVLHDVSVLDVRTSYSFMFCLLAAMLLQHNTKQFTIYQDIASVETAKTLATQIIMI